MDKRPPDPHTFALPNEALVKHLFLDIEIDFDQKQIEGSATYTIEKNRSAQRINFDIDGLKINGVVDQDQKDLPFEISSYFKYLGKNLSISLNKNTEKVSIQYSTTENSRALQWLSAEQTADKTSPFLFTQSQAILARTWIPIQDSPGIRFTYDAKVKVPENLLAVMSAQNPQEKNDSGVYEFTMKQAIPSYLMALAVGDFEYRKIGRRTGVYAEPSMIEAAVYEFSDMEKMVIAAEKLYGPYIWEQFDMIVLPPSFPFGGMENPRLTFATPTIIAGDKSLTTLVAHELAHSWSGNLVTNATWNDFWLNEGFTVYFERRIMESLYGKDYADMLAVIGYKDLLETVENMGNKNADTKLKLNLEGRNPDDGMTDIAYEKGYFLIRLIEENLGRKKWDAFLKNYFTENAFKTKTTEEFLLDLKNHFIEDSAKLNDLNIEQWIYEPGIPENCPVLVSKKFENVDVCVSNFLDTAGFKLCNTKKWSSHEWLYFLRNLPDTISLAQIELLDSVYQFTNSKNAEILAAWFPYTIKTKYQPAYEKLDSFLSQVGRRKFVAPLFKVLIEEEENKIWAKNLYGRVRKNYHAVTQQTIDELLY